MDSTAIYTVTPGQGYGSLSVQESWRQQKGDAAFNPNYNSFCSFPADSPALVAMDPQAMCMDAYQLDTDGTGLTLKRRTRTPIAYDAIRSFTFGGIPHVLAYEAASGTIDFYRMDFDLSLRCVHSYRRSYGHVTSGYTTIEPYDYRGAILLLGYNRNNGDVALDQMQVTATTPLALSPVWTSKWATGWARFTPFKVGGENFFLKYNNNKGETAYIEHFADDPAEGSRSVGRNLPTVAPTAIAPLSFDGIPYFASYHESGNASLQRIHFDCQGWSEAVTFDAVPHAAHVVPLYGAERTCVLTY